ncbi:MAG: cytochrome c3 family protein [Candidatus Riflebacteria bacterium]|nr:cytochrome c3 family protein [Candidatus Riflebacteria bacterium]
MKRSTGSLGFPGGVVTGILAACLGLAPGGPLPAHASGPTAPSAVATALVTAVAATISLTGAMGAPGAASLPPLGSCGDCHTDQVTTYQVSVHGRQGLTCTDCHGGDPTVEDPDEAMSPGKKFVGKPDRRQVPSFCGRCHADPGGMSGTEAPAGRNSPHPRPFPEGEGVKGGGPFDQYQNSVHGKRVLVDGDVTAAVCTDCHGGHDALPVEDPRSSAFRANVPATCDRCHGDDLKMNVYALPTDQLKKWRHSFHGLAVLQKKDLSAAICTDCHGIHDIADPREAHSRVHPLNVVKTCARCHGDEKLMKEHGLSASAPSDYTQGVHGKALLEHARTAAPNCTGCHGHHSALPPAVKEISMACGRCHVRSEESYNRSPHKQVQSFRGCLECHGNHRIARPDPQLFVSACKRCHAEGTPALDRGKRLAAAVETASEKIGAAARELSGATGYGFSLGKLQAILDEGRQAEIEVVPALHSLDPSEGERLLARADEVDRAVRTGVESIRTRILLRSLSLGMVLLGILAAVLVFKLKLARLTREDELQG